MHHLRYRVDDTDGWIEKLAAVGYRAIWYKQSWRVTGLNIFDGLVYGLLTGGVFGWLVV